MLSASFRFIRHSERGIAKKIGFREFLGLPDRDQWLFKRVDEIWRASGVPLQLCLRVDKHVLFSV